ncbi:hypothetical protein O181_014721 [Austropuccinia psidii MF-1]|uniref:Uncharacterized protein n=1 Tax=Austropuccinia psidii MF-1 TaxID=1389203 RepID=A0A9Q3BYM7_9BASI|nr:hypothetical protein [Austropuccinia psidii MF-1]
MSEIPEKTLPIILDSSDSPSLFVNHNIKYRMELPSLPSCEWDCLVLDTPKGEDLILGFGFLNHFNTSIDWRQGLLSFNSDDEDYYDPSKSFSNESSPSKSCAALVGDSRKHHFHLLSIFLTLIPITNYYPLEMKSSNRFKMLEKIILFLHFISSLGILAFLLHLIMTCCRSCWMKRKSKKK